MWTTQKHVPCWDLPARLMGTQLGVKTLSPIHEGAFMTHLSMVLSHVSLALSMRLRLVSVVGEFLWSGERPVDKDVQCFPGGH